MRTRDIEVGSTYLVFVPYRLPADRYPEQSDPGTPAWKWTWLRGCRFRFTVTEIDLPLVDGFRIIDTAQTRIELTDEQAAALGLPAFGHYRIAGTLFDDQDRPVRLPALRPLQVLARWLQPVTSTPNSHCDIDSIGLW